MQKEGSKRSFSAKVKEELYPLQKKYFTLLEKKLSIDEYFSDDMELADQQAGIRGAFLLGGSVSDPSKSYHFEIMTKTKEESEDLAAMIQRYGVSSRIYRRKGSYVIYVKDGDDIAVLLGVMGAHSSLMEFENARIYNEMRGNIHRQVNFETANIKKTVNTSLRQIDAIHKIEREKGLEILPDPLLEIAKARLTYPDATLAQLGKYLHPPVGKSGVNHRLRKIIKIAENI